MIYIDVTSSIHPKNPVFGPHVLPLAAAPAWKD